jgi:hypothetical protein
MCREACTRSFSYLFRLKVKLNTEEKKCSVLKVDET